MNNTFRRFGIAIVVAISVPLFAVAVHFILIRIRMFHLQRADHTRILFGCREAIAKRATYRNDRAKWGTLHEGDVLLLPPIPTDIPEAIRELNPKNIIITGDYVMIDVSLPLSRIGLIGFAANSNEFGTFKYIDGLWFWNGNKQKSFQHQSN